MDNHAQVYSSRDILLKRQLFPPLNSFEPLSESMDHRHIGLFQDSQFYFNDLKFMLLPVQHHFDYCYFVVS